MSIDIVCSRCGFVNPRGQIFCSRCAERLNPKMPSTATPASQIDPRPPFRATTILSYEAKKGVDRTFTGILLIIIGFFLVPIPYANYVGSLLLIVGAVLVILEREFFGQRHSKLVIRSLGIYVAGLAIFIVNALAFASLIVSAITLGLSPSAMGQLVSQAFNDFLVGLIISGAVTGIAIVLFTYALQSSAGKLLLWAGYVATLAVGVAIFYTVSQQVATAVQQATSSSPPNTAPITALQGEIQLVSLANFIPAVINAISYFLVLLRIKDGEIPAR